MKPEDTSNSNPKNKPESLFFNKLHLIALNRLGDALIPGDETFPSFRKLGCIEHIDVFASGMKQKDLDDFKLLMSLLFFVPKFLMNPLMSIITFGMMIPGPLGTICRLSSIGIKGAIFGLYYSGLQSRNYQGKNPNELIGYDVSVNENV